MKRRALKRRYGRASIYRDTTPVHFLVDWSYIACQKRKVDTSRLQASREPIDVTCAKCKRAQPHYDWERLAEYKAQGGR